MTINLKQNKSEKVSIRGFVFLIGKLHTRFNLTGRRPSRIAKQLNNTFQRFTSYKRQFHVEKHIALLVTPASCTQPYVPSYFFAVIHVPALSL